MGIPYSKQINAAFDQVTPLVAQGFEVLQTTKNISILLAVIQVLTVLLQLLAVVLLIALLITVNPDLKVEREALVTPALVSLASLMMPGSEARWILKVVAWMLLCVWLCGCTGAVYYFSIYNDQRLQVGADVPCEDPGKAAHVDAVTNPDTGK